MKEYEDEIYSHIIGEKVFCCSIGNKGKRFYNQTDNYKVELIPELFGSHLEGITPVLCCMLYMLTELTEGILLYVQMAQTSVIKSDLLRTAICDMTSESNHVNI